MWIDALAVGVLGLLVVSGLVRGALAAGLALVSLVGAYLAALILAPGLGPVAAAAFELPLLLGAPVAGAVVFLAAYVGLGLLSAVLRHQAKRRRAGDPRSAGDRALGGVFGALRGGVLVLLIGYLGVWIDALQTVGGAEGLPPVGDSTVAAASQSLAESAASALVDEGTPGGRLKLRAAVHPAETFGAMRELLEDPRVEALRADGAFWLAVEQDDIDGALNRVSFLAIAYSREVRQRFAAFGVVEEAAVDDPKAFRDAAAEALHQVAPRIRNLRKDPEFQELARDPEVVQLVDSGDTLGLLRHPRFRRLVDRVVATEPRAG